MRTPNPQSLGRALLELVSILAFMTFLLVGYSTVAR